MMHALQAQFSDVDDLLREAAHGRLRNHGSIVIENSGRIGPLVELLAGAQQFPAEYASVSFEGSFVRIPTMPPTYSDLIAPTIPS